MIYEIISGNKNKRRGPFIIMANGSRIGGLYRTRTDALKALQLAEREWNAVSRKLSELRGDVQT